MRVYLEPIFRTPDTGEGGIRRVVEAQRRYLPEFGVELVDDIHQADLTAGHGGTRPLFRGKPFVSHSHGLYWSDYTWRGEDHANRRVIDNLLCADAITVPSQWVRNAYVRGLLREPEVIYHGVEAEEWTPQEPGGYVLWNKPRQDAVSNPDDFDQLVARMPDQLFVATLGKPANNVRLIGRVSYSEMHGHIERASVYLATARETFGIGTLEALASGVPVAGWRYGGQREIVVEGETGYLAEPGNYPELAEAVRKCLSERGRLGANARADVERRWQWRDKIEQYALLYGRVLDGAKRTPAVSVIVTCRNLAHYLPAALDSVLAQTFTDWECIIVNDASTDDTERVCEVYEKKTPRFSSIISTENLKLSRARNAGFVRARGRYVINLDADDVLAPHALEQLVRGLENNRHLHIVYGSLEILSEDGKEHRPNPFPRQFSYLEQMAHLNQLYYAALMRREVWEQLGGYRERMWRAEDASFWCRAVSFGFRAAKVTDETCLLWRFRADGKSATERRDYPDIDGDWTELFPWAIAHDMKAGAAKKQANALQIPHLDTLPFGAPVKEAKIWHREHPLVSIVIPLGPGHLRYMIDALESCIAQTFHNWEAIVVNDTGVSIDRIPGAPYARIVSTGGEKGAGAARNVGLQQARGSLVLFLDADDMLHPNALAAMLEAYAKADAAYIYSAWRVVRPDGQKIDFEAKPYDRQAWLIGKNEGRNVISVLMATADARRIPFDEQMVAYEDWDWFCQCAVQGLCGSPLNQVLVTYRQHGDGRSVNAKPHHTDLVHLIRKRYDDYARGAEEMAKCCGGNKRAVDEIQAARAAMLGGPAPTKATNVVQQAPVQDGHTRMRFTGDRKGPVTYYANGRPYTGANSDEWRFIDALNEDVERLEAMGVWTRVRLIIRPPEPVTTSTEAARAVTIVESGPLIEATAAPGPVSVFAPASESENETKKETPVNVIPAEVPASDSAAKPQAPAAAPEKPGAEEKPAGIAGAGQPGRAHGVRPPKGRKVGRK